MSSHFSGPPAMPDVPVASACGEALDAPYQLIFEAAGIGMVRLSLSGRILEANQRFSDLVGRRRADLAGLHAQDITHPDDLAHARAHLEAALAGHTQSFLTEQRYVRPDGQWIWAALNVAMLRDAQGQPAQLIAIVEDISERQQMQDAMSSARSAERASKAKTEFLSRMSHELRTPLNAMLGFAHLLRVDPRAPLHPDQRAKVDHIERAGAHLLAMLTDVLDLSRIEAGSLPIFPEAVPMHEVMSEAVAMVTHQASEASLHLVCTEPEPGLCAHADLVRLRQVLVNLLSNGIKYNQSGGRVMVEALAMGRELVIVVNDTGRGMTPAQIGHLYEPFNRLGAERSHIEGTGIGLVIVKRLVELMHGRIDVSSQPGSGTQFRVWLPRTEAPDNTVGPPSRPRTGFGLLDGGMASGLTVLYAEDNAVNVELVRQVMRLRPHWHLDVATCGQEAIDMALARPPDLLLLDMHLGDMSGLDVSDALALHPATAAIPRVALSADVMPDQISEARRRGFVDYLSKPLAVGLLLSVLDSCAHGEAL